MTITELVEQYGHRYYPPEEFIELLGLQNAPVYYTRAAWDLAKARREAFRLFEVKEYSKRYYHRSLT